MATLHKIKAHLYNNALTENPNDFIARVASERSLSVSDIAGSATTRGGADISASAMEHAVNLWLKEMAYRLCDGFSINTGYFYASANIKGVFNSATENFNPSKHNIVFDFNQGSLMRKELGNIEVQILGVSEAGSLISQVLDLKTGSVNEQLTPNRNLRISGSKIKVVGQNNAVGIYFVNQETNERVKVDSSDIVTNNPSELIIVIPGLESGTYKIEVTTQFTTSTTLRKQPKTAYFDKMLSVL